MTDTQYRLYLENDLNRVFSGSVPSIAAAELSYMLGVDAEAGSNGRGSYLSFTTGMDTTELVAGVGSLCASLALFEETAPESLRPIELNDELSFGTELATAQRYRGKTNERLTRLMVNLAMATSQVHMPVILDPMCGRGTTLNWSLLYGRRSVGYDDDRRSLEEYATFIQQWAKSNRLPHRIVNHKKKNAEQRVMSFTVGRTRKDMDAKSAPDIETFHLPAGDSAQSLPKQPKFGAIVVDLPYGVQHSMVKAGGSRRVGVGELVAERLGEWASLTAKDASLVMAWNVRETKRSEMDSVLMDSPFPPQPTADFSHVVDRTITRDIVVSRKASNQ